MEDNKLPVTVVIPGRGFHAGFNDPPDDFKLNFPVCPFPAGLSLIDNFIKIHLAILSLLF